MKLLTLIIFLYIYHGFAVASIYKCSNNDGATTYSYSKCNQLEKANKLSQQELNLNNVNKYDNGFSVNTYKKDGGINKNSQVHTKASRQKNKKATTRSLQFNRQKELNQNAKNFDGNLKAQLRNSKKTQELYAKQQKQLIKKQYKCENINLEIQYANNLLVSGVSLTRKNSLEQKLKKLYLQQKMHCIH